PLDLRRRSLRLIESMQAGYHAANFIFTDPIFVEQLVQEEAMSQFFHFHGVLDNFPFAVKGKTGSGFIDRHDAAIHLRSKSSIQFNLGLEELGAFFQRAEIEKAEIDRLLHFEDKRRSKKNP